MKNQYSVISNAFSEDECRELIECGLSKPLNMAYSPGMRIDPDTRSSMVRFMYTTDDCRWIFDRLWDIQKTTNYPLNITTLNFLQFTEYDAYYAGHFGKHKDTEIFYHPTNRSKLIRKLTLLIQLSDPNDYSGGDLVIYPHDDDTETIYGQRDRGCAIMFPSNTLHEIKKVVKGVRYSLVAWFEGPK